LFGFFRTCTILHSTAQPYVGQAVNARRVMYLIHTQRSALNQWIAHVTMEERVMERGTLSKKTAIHGVLNF